MSMSKAALASPEISMGCSIRAFATAIALAAAAGGVASAHEHTAPWLDESKLDGGLYVEVRHPRVIRRPGAFDVTVVVNNLSGPADVTLREIRYVLPGAFEAVVHRREDALVSRRAAYRQYKGIEGELHEAAEKRDRAAVERLSSRGQSLLGVITSATIRDRHRVEASFVPGRGSTLSLGVEIDVVGPSGPRTLRRNVDILVAPPLPTGPDGSWFAGDQHLHTAYSIDAFFLNGTREGVAGYAHVARTVGLDWIIVSDHTNVGLLVWYKPVLFRLGEIEAKRVRNAEDYLVLQGQEMGVGANGPFGEPAHVLAYPREADSMGFLPNPCSGLIFNHVNCEAESIVLERINDNGGIAFIAHPFDSFPLSFAPWNVRERRRRLGRSRGLQLQQRVVRRRRWQERGLVAPAAERDRRPPGRRARRPAGFSHAFPRGTRQQRRPRAERHREHLYLLPHAAGHSRLR